jgi:hypothetical protein
LLSRSWVIVKFIVILPALIKSSGGVMCIYAPLACQIILQAYQVSAIVRVMVLVFAETEPAETVAESLTATLKFVSLQVSIPVTALAAVVLRLTYPGLAAPVGAVSDTASVRPDGMFESIDAVIFLALSPAFEATS